MGESKIVLGVDSSTQSTKVEARRVDTGEVVGVGRSSHPPTEPPRSEQDPAAWWGALVDAVGQLGDLRNDVVAISVAGQQHGMVVLGENDEVLRPAKLWNDTESAPEATKLVEDFGAQNWANACGSVPVAAFTVTKVAWLAAHEPDVFAKLAKVMLPHDWLTYQLTGNFVTDRGDVSGTGWWSPTIADYDDVLLEQIGLSPEALPKVLAPLEDAGTLRADAAAELGLSEAVVVGAGSGDNMGAALGLGLTPADVVVSLGTSGTIYGVSSSPTSDATGAVAGFADATGRFLPLVCTLNATKVTEAVRTWLDVDHDELNEMALAEPLGADGVMVLPYFDGERTPNRPHASGMMSGLRPTTSRGQLARAGFEGVVHAMLDGLEALTDAGVAASGRLLLVGGGAKSAAYRQILADLSQREVTIPFEDEVVATGAAVQAAALSSGDSLEDVAVRWGLGAGDVVSPSAEATPERVGELRSDYGALRDGAQ